MFLYIIIKCTLCTILPQPTPTSKKVFSNNTGRNSSSHAHLNPRFPSTPYTHQLGSLSFLTPLLYGSRDLEFVHGLQWGGGWVGLGIWEGRKFGLGGGICIFSLRNTTSMLLGYVWGYQICRWKRQMPTLLILVVRA